MILVMQKNIFSDLMPMHQAYVDEGLSALEEMQRAGLFGHDVLDAWRDVASGDPDRIAQGNAALLQREQGVIIRDQWDRVRAYKGDVERRSPMHRRLQAHLRLPAWSRLARFGPSSSRRHSPTDAPRT